MGEVYSEEEDYVLSGIRCIYIQFASLKNEQRFGSEKR